MSDIQDTILEIKAALSFVATRLDYLEEITVPSPEPVDAELSKYIARTSKGEVPTAFSYGNEQKEQENRRDWVQDTAEEQASCE